MPARRVGTEAFPDLGAHCDAPDCNQLDFLPFVCDGCDGAFCLKHRTYRGHGCAKAPDQGLTVVLCEACGAAIQGVPGQDDKALLDAHARSGSCDPAKKHKPRCPVRRCKETLTFCNTCDCKRCGRKVCLKHRFPGDHDCAVTACLVAKKHKLRCPVRRCKETLTFCNTCDCKRCGKKVCLKHRFPGDHDCAAIARLAVRAAAPKMMAGRRQCDGDAQKKKVEGGGGLATPPLLSVFKMF